MNVACLVPYPLSRVPGQRFRLEQWESSLRNHGVNLSFFPLLSSDEMDVLYLPGHIFKKSRAVLGGVARRLRWMNDRIGEFDVVVIHREALLLGTDLVERSVARRKPTIFDFDDAVWLPNVSRANRAFRFLKGFGKIDRIIRRVDVVTAGCEFLADHARSLNENVFTVPTSIDLKSYSPPRVHEAGQVLRIGWTGSATTGPYVRLVANALQRAATLFPLEVVVLGATVNLTGVAARCIPWSSEIEVDVIRSFDVGIKPSPKESWVLGKCPMKDLQYMALGVPPVATRYGTASESITHGITGFLCDTDDDWINAFMALRDPQKRAEIGARARLEVERRYSSDFAASLFATALHTATRVFASRRQLT